MIKHHFVKRFGFFSYFAPQKGVWLFADKNRWRRMVSHAHGYTEYPSCAGVGCNIFAYLQSERNVILERVKKTKTFNQKRKKNTEKNAFTQPDGGAWLFSKKFNGDAWPIVTMKTFLGERSQIRTLVPATESEEERERENEKRYT